MNRDIKELTTSREIRSSPTPNQFQRSVQENYSIKREEPSQQRRKYTLKKRINRKNRRNGKELLLINRYSHHQPKNKQVYKQQFLSASELDRHPSKFRIVQRIRESFEEEINNELVCASEEQESIDDSEKNQIDVTEREVGVEQKPRQNQASKKQKAISKVQVDPESETTLKRAKGYDQHVTTIRGLNQIDWNHLDPMNFPSSPLRSPPLTVTSFWFYLCSEYYQRWVCQNRVFREHRRQLDILPIICEVFSKKFTGHDLEPSIDDTKTSPTIMEDFEEFAQFISSQFSTNNKLKEVEIRIGKRKVYGFEDDLFISSINAHFAKRIYEFRKGLVSTLETDLKAAKTLPLDLLIKSISSELYMREENNPRLIANLQQNIINSENEININVMDSENDLLKDLFVQFEEEKEFLELLERHKQNNPSKLEDHPKPILLSKKTPKKTTILSSLLPVQSEAKECVCKVCNSGDYYDNDEIISCDRCNISVHQSCYLLHKFPAGNWVCDLCRKFGPSGRFVACPLCPIKGGVMRETQFKCTNSIFQKSYTTAIKNGEKKIWKCDQSELLGKNSVEINAKNYRDYLYYNYYDIEGSTSQVKPIYSERAWVHLSCALWLPEIGICDENEWKDSSKYIEFTGIESIDNRRFDLECQACESTGGAVIQCSKEGCSMNFHIECARISGVFMECIGVKCPKYLIYCNQHAPLKIKRIIDKKRKQAQEDISHFCKCVATYLSSFQRKSKDREALQPPILPYKGVEDSLKKTKSIKPQKNISKAASHLFDNKFMRELCFYVSKYPEFGNVVQLNKNGGSYKFLSYTEPKKSFWNTKISKSHRVWSEFSKKRMLKSESIYNKYIRVLNGAEEEASAGLEERMSTTVKVQMKKAIKKPTRLIGRRIANIRMFSLL